MNGVARIAVLDLRTIMPYKMQALLLFGVGVLIFANKPAVFVPALVLLFTAQYAGMPFNVADKAGLETLYAVLPVPRRAVVAGHYAWAVGLYLAIAGAGTVLAVVLARVQGVALGAGTLADAVVLSWAVFAVNVALQFPLLIRFGYTRSSVLGTALPMVAVVGIVYKTHVTIASIGDWLPFIAAAGIALLAGSAAVAQAADRRRGQPRRVTASRA
ncbi:ABC-2 transporter permease [Dactylosporangium sp. CS-047395]|uniref:ABC-2 transporter permease n=1 Tax=Dactylosporangium sp. CS-047395 TaxID=3239936 RepID=UPI003D8EF7B2